MNIQRVQQAPNFRAKLPLVGSTDEVITACRTIGLDNPSARYIIARVESEFPEDAFSAGLVATGKEALALAGEHGQEVPLSRLESIFRQLEVGVLRSASDVLSQLKKGINPASAE